LICSVLLIAVKLFSMRHNVSPIGAVAEFRD